MTEPTLVVGIGGSAGSLDALERFFRGLQPNTTMSFVVVTHRDPRSKEMMTEILTRFTPMRVCDATQGATFERGVVYVVPSRKHLAIRRGRVHLLDRPTDLRARSPIDALFRALAAHFGARSAGVVLSGMGADGTAGLAAIKASLGAALVQEPSSATYESMPRSAIVAGLADFTGTPESLARTLDALSARVAKTSPQAEYDAVLAAVRARTGHDFSQYKKNTLRRRIERRMNLLRVSDMPGYLARLAREPEEIDRLLGDLLIGVTRFFRDTETFDALRRDVLPSLLDGVGPERPLRAWVAGCATGEEAYSLAIAIRECWEERHGTEPLFVQIYATDLDPAAIRRARLGVYAGGITADVSPERLARFFVSDGSGHRVKKAIRDMVVFATQNLVSDPPFTKLHILSCRNVLIYLEPDLQRKLLPLFLYALEPSGVLVLGASEGVNGFEAGFKPRAGDLKIFARHASAPRAGRALVDFPVVTPSAAMARASARVTPHVAARPGLSNLVEHTVIEHFAPPVIVVDKTGELLYASRPTGRYFQPPAGKVTTNVFAMAREGLALPLRRGLRRALARGEKVTQRRVAVRTNGHEVLVDLSVLPLCEGDFAGHALVAFDESPQLLAAPRPQKGGGKKGARPTSTANDRAALLRLRETKAQLGALMSEMRRSEDAIKIVNEVLQSTNEELQSTNEELQSANEELTTSKEEMQSMNEELLSLNAELQTTNEQLATTNDDMRNLLNSSKIPTLFLDNDLRLKRYTAEATRIARLIPTDVGRPITDLAWCLRYMTLARDVKKVLRTLTSMEREVSADDGATYTMQVHPYRTMDDIVDGVVITFIDITAQKREAATRTRDERALLVARIIGRWAGVAWVEEVSTRRSIVVSAASAELLGVPQDVLDGSTDAFWQKLRRPKRGAKGKDARGLRLRRGDGKLVAFDERTVLLASDEDGAPTHVLHFLERRGDADGATS